MKTLGLNYFYMERENFEILNMNAAVRQTIEQAVSTFSRAIKSFNNPTHSTHSTQSITYEVKSLHNPSQPFTIEINVPSLEDVISPTSDAGALAKQGHLIVTTN